MISFGTAFAAAALRVAIERPPGTTAKFVSSGTSLADTDADMTEMLGALYDANIPMASRSGIMSSRTFSSLALERGSGGGAAYAGLGGVTRWHVAMQPGKRRELDSSHEWARLLERAEQLKASVRAKVEHPFHVSKNLFRHKKVRYKGLAKNEAQLFSLFGLANLVIAKRALLALHARGASCTANVSS